MRSLGWHVDNACPLLIKGATTRLDVIAGDDTAGIPPDPRLEPRVEPASTVRVQFHPSFGKRFSLREEIKRTPKRMVRIHWSCIVAIQIGASQRDIDSISRRI